MDLRKFTFLNGSFFDEVKFLEEVIISNRPSFCNSEEGEHLSGEQTPSEDETGSEVNSVVSEPQHPKRRQQPLHLQNWQKMQTTRKINGIFWVDMWGIL